MGLQRILISVCLLFLWCDVVFALTPHKTFVIRSYMGMDLLCGPYTVQEKDCVIDILKRKGMLSKKDFPGFLIMLRQINPHISDLNRIYPGQQIIVPLKYVKSTAAGSPGSLIIPVLPDILYCDYKVRAGDSVGRILANHYDIRLCEIKKRHLQAFKDINPDIKDINTIYPGQSIHVPILKPSRDLLWEEAARAALIAPEKPKERDEPAKKTSPVSGAQDPRKEEKNPLSIMDKGTKWSRVILSEAVKPLGGDLICSGRYYLPARDGTEHMLDLAAFPLLECCDRRILLDPEKKLSGPINDVLSESWKDLKVMGVDKETHTQSVLEGVIDALGGSSVKGKSVGLSDGVSARLRGDWVFSARETESGQVIHVCVTVIRDPKKRTPQGLQRYLAANGIYVIDVLAEKPVNRYTASEEKTGAEGPLVVNNIVSDKRALVANLLDALGVAYLPDTALAFSHAGFDLEITTNLGTCPDGTKLIVDFESAHSGIAPALGRQGIKCVLVETKETILAIGRNIVESLGISFVENPIFSAVDRGGLRTVALTIPGIFISPPGRRDVLLTPVCLDNDISAFLEKKSIKILKGTGTK